jgi:hypothetical protein
MTSARGIHQLENRRLVPLRGARRPPHRPEGVLVSVEAAYRLEPLETDAQRFTTSLGGTLGTSCAALKDMVATPLKMLPGRLPVGVFMPMTSGKGPGPTGLMIVEVRVIEASFGSRRP